MKYLTGWLIVSFFIILGCSVNAAAQDTSNIAVEWNRWEKTLISSETSNARPSTVQIEFEGPGGAKFKTVAFTDDGIHYVFRAAFPGMGSWKWTSACSNKSDEGLNDVRGRVEVVKYDGGDPLYIHGDLKVSKDRRYLVHADGIPFLWIGDAGWNASYKSTMEEWQSYVDIRSLQGFSVIQITPRGIGNKITASEKPDVAFTHDGKPDTAFWRNLEEKIAYANDKGIFVLLAGVGNAWRDKMAENAANQEFEYYISARLSGHMVIFSPSFDQLFQDELDKVASELHRWTSHLVTQVPGTNVRVNLTFRNSNSIDFTGLHSGHMEGDLNKVYASARQWTLDMWGGSPVKPIILLGSMYDAYGNNNGNSWREMDSRKTGWIAWMSGAKGFTYGCGEAPPWVTRGHGGVWMFNNDSATYDYWRKALTWPSAKQMTYMRMFLSTIDWWKLTPSPDLIRNQETTDTLQMMTAKSFDLNTIIAYMPDNPKIVIDMTHLTGSYKYSWFNPQTGELLPSIQMNGGDQNTVFIRPPGWDDAVLKISKN